MKSTMGRPRLVTDEQIEKIIAWHEALEAWKAQRKSLPTLRGLAQELRLSPGTITYVLRQEGVLKQASPEHRDFERERRRRRLQQPRAPSAR